MLKLAPSSLLKSTVFALALALTLPPASADPRPSNSFKSGFSSQRSSSSSSSSSKGGFGSFNKRSSSSSSQSSSANRDSAPSGGGFGSFGRGAVPDGRQSDSALSRKLERDAAQARALRTLEERRAAQAARNQPERPAPPDYGQASRNQPGNERYNDSTNAPPGYGQAQPRRDSGLGQVIAGAVIANAAANAAAHAANNAANNAHANRSNGGYQQPAPMPEPTWNGGVGSINGQAAGGQAMPVDAAGRGAHQSRGGSVFGTIVTLGVLALVVWGVVALVRRRKRKAVQQHYSFERK
jgi:hypothetical protein